MIILNLLKSRIILSILLFPFFLDEFFGFFDPLTELLGGL